MGILGRGPERNSKRQELYTQSDFFNVARQRLDREVARIMNGEFEQGKEINTLNERPENMLFPSHRIAGAVRDMLEDDWEARRTRMPTLKDYEVQFYTARRSRGASTILMKIYKTS